MLAYKKQKYVYKVLICTESLLRNPISKLRLSLISVSDVNITDTFFTEAGMNTFPLVTT
jgi:hypothetical protein